MILTPTPLTDHGRGFFTWHAYDPSCKAELWSTAAYTLGGCYLFDPIPWPDSTPVPQAPVQIIRTNENHDRACLDLTKRFSGTLNLCPHEFQAIPLPGGGENETAYFHPHSQSLVVGDALIHLKPGELAVLPDKYCTNPTLLKQSLQQLGALKIERIFFAHGVPISQNSQSLLQGIL